MTCHKLSSVIFFSMPMINVLLVDINKIKNQLNEDFYNRCDWFVDNKLSIHFDEDRTKSILFASKLKRKNIKKLHIKYADIQIKQHSKDKYLGCLLDETVEKLWHFTL